jgi:hypothetical protein
LICEPTDYTFVLVEVIVDSVTYKVDLKNDDVNFYVVGNLLNDMYINYLLYNIHGLENVTKYSVKILDQNVTSVDFDETKSLKFNKTDYILV